MRQSTIILLVGAYVFSSPALAETWVLYGKDRSGADHYWDKDSIVADDKGGWIWEKFDPPFDKIIEIKIRRLVRCGAGDMAISQGEKVSVVKKGELNFREIFTVPVMEMEPKPYVKGSISEQLFRVVCPDHE